MTIHDLKIDPKPFADLLSGAKTCEVRNDDRDFEVGDTVRFPGGHCCTISHIQRGYGLPDGLCVLSYAQASAAPEQEPAAWRVVGCGNTTVTPQYPSWAELDDRLEIEGLHARAAPSEVERLRAELKAWMNAEAEKGIELVQLRHKLAEAQALLLSHSDHVAKLSDALFRTCAVMLGPDKKEFENAIYAALADQQAVNAFLSATAKPAEVKCETCRDSGIIGHSNICPVCVDSWEPAQPADGVKSDE